MKKLFISLLILLFGFSTPVSAYTVQRGDTVSKLAQRFNTTIQDITQNNNLKNPNRIYVGQHLDIEELALGSISRPELFYSENITRSLALGGSETTIYVSTLPHETTGYLIINSGSTATRELIKYTGVTSTNQLTGVTRGLAEYGTTGVAISDTSVAANIKKHSSGESIIMSNGRYEQNIIDQLNGYTTSSISGTTKNNFYFGDGTNTDKSLLSANGDANLPFLRYYAVGNKWVYSNDGVTSLDVGGGTGSILAGDHISIVGGVVSVSSTVTSSVGSVDVSKIPNLGTTGKLDSSFGGATSSLATLNASSTVVENPASATAIPTSTSIPIADSNGEINTWLNQNRLNVHTYTAGENLNSTAQPIAVYLSRFDGLVYKLNSSTASSTLFDFLGFEIYNQNVTTGNTVLIQTDGLASNFTGLITGTDVYGTDTAGVVSSTAGTIKLKLGIAKNSTQLLISRGKKIYNGRTIFISSAFTDVVTGFKPSKVRVEGFQDTDHTSSGGWAINGGNIVAYSNGSAGGANSSNGAAWILGVGGNTNEGTISSASSTGFTLSNVKTGAPGTAYLYWEAEE